MSTIEATQPVAGHPVQGYAVPVERTGRLWDVDRPTYFADRTAVSHSMLEVFIEDPELFEGRFITGEYPEEQKACYDFGTLVHDAVLQGGTQCVIVEIPRDVLSKSGSKAGFAWEQFEAEHSAPGKYLLKSQDIQPIRKCFDAIMRHPKARAILEFNGEYERPIRWTHRETGLELRSMLDKLTPVFVGDLKTTTCTNARQFARRAYDLGYFRQAAMYLEAAWELTGDMRGFVFITVRPDPPYAVRTFVPDEDSIGLGRMENLDALRDLARCKETGVYRSDDWGKLLPIAAPRYAFSVD